MYDISLYKAFVQLRKQYYKIKTSKWNNKYSDLEKYKNQYKTIKKFCNLCDDYVYSKYIYCESQETIQEVFEKMLEQSQKNTLKFYIV